MLSIKNTRNKTLCSQKNQGSGCLMAWLPYIRNNGSGPWNLQHGDLGDIIRVGLTLTSGGFRDIPWVAPGHVKYFIHNDVSLSVSSKEMNTEICCRIDNFRHHSTSELPLHCGKFKCHRFPMFLISLCHPKITCKGLNS